MLVAQPAIRSLGLLIQLPRVREQGYAAFRVAWSRPFGADEYLPTLLAQFNRGLMSFGAEEEGEAGPVLFVMTGRPRVPPGEALPDRWPDNVDARLASRDFEPRVLVMDRLPSGYESQGMAFYQQ